MCGVCVVCVYLCVVYVMNVCGMCGVWVWCVCGIVHVCVCVLSWASKLIPSGLSQTLKHAETRHCMQSTSGEMLG